MKYFIWPLFLLLSFVFLGHQKAEAVCNFYGDVSDYLEPEVSGIKVRPDNLPDYDYNNRYYATTEAATRLADCLGGTVTPIASGFAADSPYIKPDALGIKLPNGQVINAGDAISVYVGWGANSGGALYDAWQKYVNLPDIVNSNVNYRGSTVGNTITSGMSSTAYANNSLVSGGSYISYAQAVANISNQLAQIYKNFQNLTVSTGSSAPTAVPISTGFKVDGASSGSTAGTLKSTTSSAGLVSKNFSHTFMRVGDMWKITLNNVAYGNLGQRSYIPESYSIVVGTADGLRAESEGRFNSSYFFPGNAEGNTFYSEMFSAFIRAYYDWEKQTN